jgi:hypothetical protein
MNEKDYKTLKELRADLFYQINAKFGPEKASKYPSIITADEVIKNYDLLHVVSVLKGTVCEYCKEPNAPSGQCTNLMCTNYLNSEQTER